MAIYKIASRMPEIGRKIYTQALKEFTVEDWKLDKGRFIRNTSNQKMPLVAHQAFLNIAPDVETALNETVRGIVLQKNIQNQEMLAGQFIQNYPGLKEDIFLRLKNFGVRLNGSKINDENRSYR